MDDKRFAAQYEEYRAAVEEYLTGLFADKLDTAWKTLYESMRYSLLSGGKRLRPVLTLECARVSGLADWRAALPFACALELVHTYSLIHDDLPCMDDDTLRRGKPTNHVVYGETMATLAGDALQPEAYRLIAEAPELDPRAKVAAVAALSWASGADGMVAGQVLDLTDYGCDRETLNDLCARKTGCLLRCAARLGCARVANLSSNVASLIVFLVNGSVLFSVGIPAICCSMLGNYLGARYAIKGGSRKIRLVMFFVLGLLFVKTILSFTGVIDF